MTTKTDKEAFEEWWNSLTPQQRVWDSTHETSFKAGVAHGESKKEKELEIQKDMLDTRYEVMEKYRKELQSVKDDLKTVLEVTKIDCVKDFNLFDELKKKYGWDK